MRAVDSEFLEELFRQIDREHPTTTRWNHQHPSPPGDGLLTCVTARVAIDNVGIFGTAVPFLTEVFPRYRYLLAKLTKFLADHGIIANVPESTLTVTMVPSPSENIHLGNALPKLERPSRGASVMSVEHLAHQSVYYRKLAARYFIEHCLITNNGTVVGPDAGIISTVCGAVKASEGGIRVIEFGTVTGTTAAALAKLGKLKYYSGNDFSPEMANFFLVQRFAQDLLRLRFLVTTRRVVLRFRIHVDIGPDYCRRYYEAQPDLFCWKGKNISASLASEGIVAVQSGKPENSFITELLSETNTGHAKWPWYQRGFCMKEYVKGVVRVNVYGETMLLGSDNITATDGLAKLLAQEEA